jgi:thioredoxin 1
LESKQQLKPLEITEENFQKEVMESEIPVLLDFWAVWCGPCKALTPIMEELAVEYEGKLKVGKVDVDNNQKLSEKYGVRSIPTMIIFKGGADVDKMIGALPKQRIVQRLGAFL